MTLSVNQFADQRTFRAYLHQPWDSLNDIIVHADFVFIVMKPLRALDVLPVATQDDTGRARRSASDVPSQTSRAEMAFAGDSKLWVP